MQRSPTIPPIIALPRDTAVSNALLHDILDVIQGNEAYQLAILEQQNRLHDTLNHLNRSLLTDQEERHTEVAELSTQVDGLRQDLNQFFAGPTYGAERSERMLLDLLLIFSSLLLGVYFSHPKSSRQGPKQERGPRDDPPVSPEEHKRPVPRDDRSIQLIQTAGGKTRPRTTAT